MSSVEDYEYNLDARLAELRHGDPANYWHNTAIIEALIIANNDSEEGTTTTRRILDVGCGLGFTTAELATMWPNQVVGIDISTKAITLAQKEHPSVPFYAASIESFAEIMPTLGEQPFDQAVLNMVLHSVDDDSASAILQGTQQCLGPEGTIILIVPTQKWIRQKLIEYAKDHGMARESGIAWVEQMYANKEIVLPMRIRRGEYYPRPITIFNRTLEDYGRLLRINNFGLNLERYDTNDIFLDSSVIPYWEQNDYSSNVEIASRGRSLLISMKLSDTEIFRQEKI